MSSAVSRSGPPPETDQESVQHRPIIIVAMTEHAVVIAGGGPTGLMLAGELALAGVDVAIVERRTGMARLLQRTFGRWRADYAARGLHRAKRSAQARPYDR